jgi:AraC-like DNA-binding protein
MMSNVAAERLAARFRTKDAPIVTARTLRRTALTFTEFESHHSVPFQTGERMKEDAFVVGMQLREFKEYRFWEDSRAAPVTDLKPGHITINDMKRDAFAIMDKPFHSLYVHIPRVALDEVVGLDDGGRIDVLRYEPGCGFHDEIVMKLLACIRPALNGSQAVSNLFLDYVGIALVSHLAETYGELGRLPMVKGGLAPWQERLAKEIIYHQMKDPAGIADLAMQCGLSVRHFTRAFQASTGLTPHEWLQKCRIDRAKTLLTTTELTLSEIGEACGFADQSHLSRVFVRVVGTPPGSWRRRWIHDFRS